MKENKLNVWIGLKVFLYINADVAFSLEINLLRAGLLWAWTEGAMPSIQYRLVHDRSTSTVCYFSLLFIVFSGNN